MPSGKAGFYLHTMLIKKADRHVILECDHCCKTYKVIMSRYKTKKVPDDYCSSACRKSVKRITRACEVCGLDFEFFASRLKREGGGQFCSKACQFKAQKKGGKVCQKYELNVMKKYGVFRPAESSLVKQKICSSVRWKDSLFKKGNKPWNKGLTSNTNSKVRDWFLRTKSNNPAFKPKGSPEKEKWRQNISRSATESYRTGKRISSFTKLTREERIALNAKISKILALKGYANKGLYTSCKTGQVHHYDSSWELERMQQLDQDVEVTFWSRSTFNIDYLDVNGKQRVYNPDLYIEIDGRKIVEEIKGVVTDNFMQKYEAAVNFFSKIDIEYRVTFRNVPGSFVVLTCNNLVDMNEGRKSLKEILGVYKSH